MTIKSVPLFDEPPTRTVQLSTMHAGPANLAKRDRLPVWAPLRVKTPQTCDECFANQHETGGQSGVRAPARSTRSIASGDTLKLCASHAELWRARDEQALTRRGRS